MNVLDENIVDSQRQLLKQWRIPIRQIGYELGQKGMKDKQIIPFLLQLRRVTFFTLDADFYKRELCHAKYCLVCMAVGKHEAAAFVRRLLRRPEFDTTAKRMGTVIRASVAGLSLWRLHVEQELHFDWDD